MCLCRTTTNRPGLTPPTRCTSDKVNEAIEAGDHDSRLDQIDRAIKARVS